MQKYLLIISLLVIVNVLKAQKPADKISGLKYIGAIQPKTSKEIQESYWGIQSGTLNNSILKYAGKIGVKWTRIMAHWPQVEKQKQSYDWANLDNALNAVLNEQITPFVSITGGNSLYTKLSTYADPKLAEIYGYKPGPPVDDEVAMQAWDAYVTAIINRYKNKVTYWEIWNEPNHRNYWGAEPDAKKYGQLVHHTALLIKKIQPNAHIIAGAMAGLFADYIDGFLSQDNKDLVEIITYHNYDIIPESRIYRADSAWKVINKYNSKIELWQGECGTPSHSSTKDYRSTSPWGLNIQAKWLLRQALTDVYFCKATMSNYFKLADEGDRNAVPVRKHMNALDSIIGFPERGGSRVKEIGVNEKCLLSNPDLKPKPGFYAYQNLCAVIDKTYKPILVRHQVDVIDQGMFYGIGKADDAFPSIPFVASFKTEDQKFAIGYWLGWHPQEFTPKPASINLYVEKTKFTNPVLVDLLKGNVYVLNKFKTTDDGSTFFGLPLLDYPFLITERSAVRSKSQP
jgi:hypothetical protein